MRKDGWRGTKDKGRCRRQRGEEEWKERMDILKISRWCKRTG